jgi:beta-lactamase regulating signal transducer with metallopeptidase domain
VVISAGLIALLDEKELEAVLRHEAHHLDHRDPLRLIVADTLAEGFRFLPLVGMLRDHLAVAQELAADRHAVRALGTDRSLAAALYKLLTRVDAPSAVPAPGATGALALRIDALLGADVPPRHHIHLRGLCWTAGIAAAMLLLLFVPLHLLTGPPPVLANALAAILP